MKKVLYILACLLFTFTCFGQGIQKAVADTEFFYLYGGANPDIGRSIKETYDKGYIIAGTSSSFGNGDADIYVVKTDSLGKHQWSKTFGGHQNDWGYSIQVTADSGYFIAGYSNSFNPQNGFDVYYVKTDKLGNLIWEKTVSGDDWDFIYGSTPMPDGGFILCGETFTNSHGGSDAYLIRINKNGDTLWTKNYGGLYDETFNNVTVMNNRIYAVGKNKTHSVPLDSAADGWIVKLDTNGIVLKDTFVTVNPYYKHFEEILSGIAPFNGDIFHFCGKTNQLDSNATVSVFGRADTSLNVYWAFIDGPSSKGTYQSFENVFNLDNGNSCIIGSGFGGNGGYDLLFVGFDPTDGFINQFIRMSGSLQNEFGYGGIFTSRYEIVGIGSSDGFCTGQEDMFLVRMNGDTIQNSVLTSKPPVVICFADTLPLWQVSTKNYSKELELNLYPNPAVGISQLNIRSNQQKEYTARIFSILGVETNSFKVETNVSNPINVSSLQPGNYFIKITDEHGITVSVVKFIVAR
ncbi:MAG: T9SS type A sorting domain-containing protein [Bacteroidia bacterium]